MKKIIRGIFALLLVAAPVVAAAPAVSASGSNTDPEFNCAHHFLGLRAWYDGLTDANCNVQNPKDDNEVREYAWTIGLNVASMIMGITGYAAIGFVIWGGIQYMIAQGDPGKVAKGKKTITNAVIGIVIVSSASMLSGMFADIIRGANKTNGKAFFGDLLGHVFLWSGIIAVVMIVYGGIQYMTSIGNPNAIQKAKTTIMYSMIGLVVVALSAAIVSAVLSGI